MDQSDNSKSRKRLDPVKTRESIALAAFEEFARVGYEGASIADIAKSAGVPKSLVQYHFGAKEALWEACIVDRVAPMLAALDRFIRSDSDDPTELIAVRFRFLRDNPELRRLFFWSGMSSFPIPSFIAERRNGAFERLGHDANNPKFVRFLAALAATDGWFMARNFYTGLFGDVILDEALEQQFLEVLLRMLKQP